MSIAKNTKEVYLEEIIDNLMGDSRELSSDAVPKTREEVLLHEIEKLLRGRSSIGGGGGSVDLEILNEYLHKTTDKADTNNFNNNSDTHYVTPRLLINKINEMYNEGTFNALLTVNGRSGHVTLSRDDVELGNVMNIKQATKVEFDEHCNDATVHLNRSKYDELFEKVATSITLSNDKVSKLNDKATVIDANEGVSDDVYMTPYTVKKSINKIIEDAGGVEFANYVLTINGRTGDVVLNRDDVELGNVMNIKQATKVEFDEHCNDATVHLTSSERALLYNTVGNVSTSVNNKLDKNSDKATILETIEGTNDTRYATPQGLKALLDSIIQPSLCVYDLKSYNSENPIVVAEILPGQSYYTNKSIIIGDVEINSTPQIATDTIQITSSDCLDFENVTLFVK